MPGMVGSLRELGESNLPGHGAIVALKGGSFELGGAYRRRTLTSEVLWQPECPNLQLKIVNSGISLRRVDGIAARS